MTESEWLACADPLPMLDALRGKASARKLRLFSCAAARLCSFYTLSKGSNDLKAILAIELWADGDAREKDVASADDVAESAGAKWATGSDAFFGARTWANAAHADKSQFAEYCDRVRCIFGNPFRAITADPAWRDWNGGTILSLARAASAERSPTTGFLDSNRLGILSDALEEAGCTDPDVLTHLRSPGPHVRGCWALDLALGKE
jgi:hypothetical protein